MATTPPKFTEQVYQISTRAEFLGHLPPNSLVFWSQQKAGGVLLLPGIHYLLTDGMMTLSVPLSVGDSITVITFL